MITLKPSSCNPQDCSLKFTPDAKVDFTRKNYHNYGTLQINPGCERYIITNKISQEKGQRLVDRISTLSPP